MTDPTREDSIRDTAFLSRRTFLGPAALIALAIGVGHGWRVVLDVGGYAPGPLAGQVGAALPLTLILIAGTLVAIRGAQALMARHYGGEVPKLAHQIIGAVAWTLSAVVLAGSVFEVPLGSLVTTSGLMVAVIGIALKNMISDLFTGLSLPLKMGDWLEVDGVVGRVVEVSWRATRLVTRDDVTMIIPNSHLMSKPFRNFSQPAPYYRENFRITLPASVTAHKAERNLMAAARQVDVIAALPVPPQVAINSFNERGIEWELRYYVPDAGAAAAVRYRVQRNLLRNLHFSGIEMPPSLIEIRHAAERPAAPAGGDDQIFLGCVDLFGTLTNEELSAISETMKRLLVRADTPVVRQGAEGDSLFVLREGLLSVSITADGLDNVVGQIMPGYFFGEMSLLTGAPRSATVTPVVDSLVYEITRETLAPIIANRLDLASQLSEVLATRQTLNLPKLAARGALEDSKRSMANQLLGRITAFFGLKPQASVS